MFNLKIEVCKEPEPLSPSQSWEGVDDTFLVSGMTVRENQPVAVTEIRLDD